MKLKIKASITDTSGNLAHILKEYIIFEVKQERIFKDSIELILSE